MSFTLVLNIAIFPLVYLSCIYMPLNLCNSIYILHLSENRTVCAIAIGLFVIVSRQYIFMNSVCCHANQLTVNTVIGIRKSMNIFLDAFGILFFSNYQRNEFVHIHIRLYSRFSRIKIISTICYTKVSYLLIVFYLFIYAYFFVSVCNFYHYMWGFFCLIDITYIHKNNRKYRR